LQVSPASRPESVAVIGAGPAGLTAALKLAAAGISVELFEAGPRVGGMAQSFDLWNQRVDMGPHRFFSSDTRVNEVWLEAVGQDYAMVDRLTRIYYRGKFFFYPLKPFNALLNLGPFEAIRCFMSYAKQRMAPEPTDDSFEGWVVSRFGRRLFEIFFKTYSEKLWGIPCTKLDADFAAQRIKKLSLFEAVKNALFKGKGNMHKTLVDRFAYPTSGAGLVYERMAERFEALGGKLHVKRPVRRVVDENGVIVGIELEDGEFRRFDHVVSTMPLTLLVSRLAEVPTDVLEAARGLRFRNTILVYLRVEAERVFPDNWLYIHSPELKTGRVTNFRNWLPSLYGAERSSILALEYWCDDEDALWEAKDDALVDLASTEIRKTGLIGNPAIAGGYVRRVPRCYPIYERGYKTKVDVLRDYLEKLRGLSVIGRYGAFKYNNQDHSILMGLLVAENLVSGTTHDLWSVNTDYENYQESSVITETGLERQQTPVGAA